MSESEQDVVAEAWPAVERRKSDRAIDWQSSVERDKAALAQSLHDNTGGLLVAAVMDISWAAGRLTNDAMHIRERLDRARAALETAIELNRRMIEELRPTLLDNFGLAAALKWHFAEVCKSSNIICEQRFPEPGPFLSSPASIALYRIAQTLIAMVVSHEPQLVMLEFRADSEFVWLKIGCEGALKQFMRENEPIASALASVTGRTKAFGGNVQFVMLADGLEITCGLPAFRALAVQRRG